MQNIHRFSLTLQICSDMLFVELCIEFIFDYIDLYDVYIYIYMIIYGISSSSGFPGLKPPLSNSGLISTQGKGSCCHGSIIYIQFTFIC